jgi:tetratricopeptide (TPR) repeat protein
MSEFLKKQTPDNQSGAPYNIQFLLESQLDKHGLIAALKPLIPAEFQGKTDKLKNALADKPVEKVSQFFCETGAINYRCGEKGMAALDFLLALEVNPNSFEALHNVGVVFNDLGDYGRAEVAYVAAIQANPKYLASWLDLGQIYLRREYYYGGVLAFNQATEIDPNSAEAWKGLGIALSGTLNFQKATEANSRALELKPDDAEVWMIFALGLALESKFDGAIEAARTALGLNPDDTEAGPFLAELLKPATREQFFDKVRYALLKRHLEKRGVKI